MVSAEAAAVGRPARFDVRGGALKLAGRLFRGALRAGTEGKLRARRPALRGVWPGGSARGAPESPPQRGAWGVGGPGGETSPSGVGVGGGDGQLALGGRVAVGVDESGCACARECLWKVG